MLRSTHRKTELGVCIVVHLAKPLPCGYPFLAAPLLIYSLLMCLGKLRPVAQGLRSLARLGRGSHLKWTCGQKGSFPLSLSNKYILKRRGEGGGWITEKAGSWQSSKISNKKFWRDKKKMHRQAQVTGSRRQRSSGERVRDEATKQTDLMGKQVRKQPDGLREKKSLFLCLLFLIVE